MARTIESLFIAGPAGKLEAILEEPEGRDPLSAALVCHPHPKHGGTMRNKVVYRLARGLRTTGSAVLRFNFRGVHLSEGVYERGVGEVEDARSALEFLRDRYPELPFTIAGFSFGSRVALKLGCDYPDATRIIAVGFPTVYQESQFLGHCSTHRVFIHSTNDEFGPRHEMERYYTQLQGPKRILWVASSDHFFSDALDMFEEAVHRI